MSTSWDAWNYPESADPAADVARLVGYHVHATDGDIGRIDQVGDAADASHLVVDAGWWIFDRKVILPAGTIQRVDDAEERVYVDLTKEQIKNSPEWDQTTPGHDDTYRGHLGTYYAEFYR
jgi:hypothetical protein